LTISLACGLWEAEVSARALGALSRRRFEDAQYSAQVQEALTDFDVCGLGLRTRTLPVSGAPTLDQKPTRCVPCRQAKRKCTHRKSDPHPSCTQCRKDRLKCNFGLSKAREENADKATPGNQYDSPIRTELPSNMCLENQMDHHELRPPHQFQVQCRHGPFSDPVISAGTIATGSWAVDLRRKLRSAWTGTRSLRRWEMAIAQKDCALCAP
jgi:hypothetical protein